MGYMNNYSRYRSNGAAYAPSVRREPRAMVDVKNTPVVYLAANVWSAAAAAHRINNGKYYKDENVVWDEATDKSIVQNRANKVIVREMLEAGNGWTEADVAKGEEALNFWKGQMMRLLGDGAISDFDKMAITIAAKDEITTAYDVAIISSLVRSAERGILREDVEIKKSTLKSEWIGATNAKVAVQVVVINCFYLANFGSYIVEGLVNDQNVVTWWAKTNLETGSKLTIKGRIKSCGFDRKDPTLKVTNLNYVKVQ